MNYLRFVLYDSKVLQRIHVIYNFLALIVRSHIIQIGSKRVSLRGVLLLTLTLLQLLLEHDPDRVVQAITL